VSRLHSRVVSYEASGLCVCVCEREGEGEREMFSFEHSLFAILLRSMRSGKEEKCRRKLYGKYATSTVPFRRAVYEMVETFRIDMFSAGQN